MLDIIEFITKIFKKDKAEETRSAARDRLKLVLVSDRASISPHLIDSLRSDLIEVISRYMTIDISSMEVGLERKNGGLAIAANIPIVDMKREKQVRQIIEPTVKPPVKEKASPSTSAITSAMIDTAERPAVKEISHPSFKKSAEPIKQKSYETANDDSASKKKIKRSSKRYAGRSQSKTTRKSS